MPILDSRGGTTVVIGLFTFVAVAAAGVGYVERRSSDAAWAEFMRAATVSATEPDRSSTRGKTGCPVGKRELPTKLIPFEKDRT